MTLVYNKRIFKTGDFYGIMKSAFSGIGDLRNSRRKKLLDGDFVHRIMLAVTEVNGCRVCSYFHTGQALRDGMSEDEIASILDGSIGNVPPDETKALFFAQHYADNSGDYSEEAWESLVKEYGIERSKAILANTRMIMMGNAYGIAYGCLRERLHGRPVDGSSISNELGILAGTLFLMPVALVASLFTRH